MHCSAPHYVALMVAGTVWPSAVGARVFASAHALYVAPSAAVLALTVWTGNREWFDSVPHSRRIDTVLDQSSRHIAPHYDEDHWRCGDHPVLPSLLDAVGAHQPPYMYRDRDPFVLSVDFIPHLLPALCAFSHVPQVLYSLDLEPLPGLIFFNNNHSLVDCAPGGDHDVDVY